MKYIKSKNGYYYKNNNSKNIRISKTEYIKNMKGGEIDDIEILSNYYLCTESRYDKPILDQLLPFGSFKELDSEVGSEEDKQMIKNLSKNIPNKKIVGSSQYGIYFRLVKKEFINSSLINSTNNINFKKNRSFIFDVERFLEYIHSNTRSIPLFWYANGNLYGYRKTIFDTITLYRYTSIKDFLNNIGIFIEKNLYDHEFVCRIPIPLNEDSGYIGKINEGILTINQELKLQKNIENDWQQNMEKGWQQNMEKGWQKNIENDWQQNMKNNNGWGEGEEPFKNNNDWIKKTQKYKDEVEKQSGNYVRWISETGKKMSGFVKNNIIKKGKNGKNQLTISNIFSNNGMTKHGKNVNINVNKLYKI
jgi:hypothetical protein